MSKSRLFFLKMPKDFFKRHDVRIIENSENGKEILLFYIKLLCESLDHDGNLRFSDKTPYSNEMLATITNTNVEVVNESIEFLKSLGLIEVLEDKTIFMSKVPEMTVSESSRTQYMRDYRNKNKHALGEFQNVYLSDEDITKLKEFYPSYWAKYIEKLSAHKESGGKSYESDYATLKKWLLKDVGDME